MSEAVIQPFCEAVNSISGSLPSPHLAAFHTSRPPLRPPPNKGLSFTRVRLRYPFLSFTHALCIPLPVTGFVVLVVYEKVDSFLTFNKPSPSHQ